MEGYKMKEEHKFEINGLNATSEERVHLIMMGKPESDKNLRVDISDTVKQHNRLYHTTKLETIAYIFGKLTLRGSSLTHANLNDKAEKSRIGITQFAGSRFITCFSHIGRESVSFWKLYGGTDDKQKVLLKFKNFSNYFKEAIHTDYCLLEDNKKLFFFSEEYTQTANRNGIFGQKLGLPPINTDFDMRNNIRTLEMIDIEYLPSKNDVFTQSYSGIASLQWGEQLITGIEVFDPQCLGKQKSDIWTDEKETRILCSLNVQEFDKWDFIDLRLKEKIFEDLIIVMNPWAEPNLESKIHEIIDSSSISQTIKNSIKIECSEAEGTIL